MLFMIVSAKSGEAISSKTFASAAEAQLARPIMEIEAGEKLRIAKVPTDSAWRMREANRLSDGTHKPLPQWWQDAPWWHANPVPIADHYAYCSREDSTQIAFTESEEKGARDIQTRMSASRYLARFFADQLRPEEIGAIAARFAAPDYKLEIASKPEDFARVYSGQKVCSESSNHPSCMWGIFPKLPHHPAFAYGAGDLAIAYFTDPETESFHVMARAVIWPEKKTFVRLYGRAESDKTALYHALTAAGYHRADDFSGAKMLAIETRNGFLMPYIDGDVQTLDEHSEGYLYITEDGDIDGEVTQGWTEGNTSRFSCSHCGDRCDEDDLRSVGGDLWCESCADSDSIYCDYHEEYYPQGDGYEIVITSQGEQTWSQNAVRRYAFACEYTSAFYCRQDFTEIEVRTGNGIEIWCEEKTEGNHFEDENGDYFATDNFTALEIWLAIGTLALVCKEIPCLAFFQCDACGGYFEASLAGEDGMCAECTAQGAKAHATIEDMRQVEMAL